VHIVGKANGPADALSRMHQKGDVKEGEKIMALIPLDTFLNVFQAEDPSTLEYEVMQSQQHYRPAIQEWVKTLPI
jgi:hypothetical protein